MRDWGAPPTYILNATTETSLLLSGGGAVEIELVCGFIAPGVAFRAPHRDICIILENTMSETPMPDGDGPSAWDFLTLITWWNLYALPALLVAAAVFAFVKHRWPGNQKSADIELDGRRLVRIAAIIHLVVGIHARATARSRAAHDAVDGNF